ncbi:MAG: sterol transfer family [Polyangiaceae bacterium]|nr:sterol transfer family [Polyangiaceae bacterium]
MTSVPGAPREFFENYLPTWFARAGAPSVTSPGALVFHVGAESYALRLDAGALRVQGGAPTDAVLQVSLSEPDFAELIRQAGPLFEDGVSDRVLALRSLSLDAERAALIRSVDGSVAFEITEGDLVRTLLLSPGSLLAGSAPPACTVRLAAVDFWALSRGEKNPFELLMDGKIRMQGRMDVAMALSSVLVG